MRRVTGYINGKAQWSENVPASTGSSKIGGELVVAPSETDRDRHNQQQRRYKAKLREQA